MAKTPPPKARDSQSCNAVSKKLAYEALSDLNWHFEKVLQNLDRLRKCGLFDTRFRRDSLRACHVAIEETRAWINFEITESLHEREERDWARFGHLRHQWKKRYEDPNDALIRAEKLMRKSARKERSIRVRA